MQTFATLWNNYPTIKGDASLLDKKRYENQGAINLYSRTGSSKLVGLCRQSNLPCQKIKGKCGVIFLQNNACGKMSM